MKNFIKTTVIIICLLFAFNSIYSQTTIITDVNSYTSGEITAVLDVHSTNKGLIIPRLTLSARNGITNPATGLLIYQTDNDPGFYFYTGSTWVMLSTTLITKIADADSDTKVQAEKNQDEDIIRFDLGGIEHMILRRNPGGIPLLELRNSMGNTLIGESAGLTTQGSNNTATGSQSMFFNISGSSNSAFGFQSFHNNNFGNENTALGYKSMFSNQAGSQNTAVGFHSLYTNAGNNRNTAIGHEAMYFGNNLPPFSQTFNTAVGCEALKGSNNLPLNTGTQNTAVGDRALFGNSSGLNNTASGVKAMFTNTSGSNNVAYGVESLFSNTTGGSNTAIGEGALYLNNGAVNTAVGFKAMYNNLNNSDNTAVGANSMYTNSTGGWNTATGYYSMYNNNNGNWNTADGIYALQTNTGGSENTSVGATADVASGTQTNSTSLGFNAIVNNSNKVRIGNTLVNVIEGQVGWSYPSDARFKFNIHDDNVPGLELINRLRPVTYQFDTRMFDAHINKYRQETPDQNQKAEPLFEESTAVIRTGFLAQELEKACKEIGFEFSGLHIPSSDVDNYSISYDSFVPVLVKAIQEQQREINNLKTQNEHLIQNNDQLNSRLERLETALDPASMK
ncbi:MAG: tail fiber domain-containing protein [Deltaproteobacteria bacterium]